MRGACVTRRAASSVERTAPNILKGEAMYNIFYIIGVIVVILAILGYLGLR